MGASNAMAAYHLYAGRVPPLSMQLLAYMALVSKDNDPRPWFGQGHAALAQFALGRPEPATAEDLRAVRRAITPLLAAGAIQTDRRGSLRRTGPSTARYRLHLLPRKPGEDTLPGIDQALVDNRRKDPPRRTKSAPTTGRKPSHVPHSHRTKSDPTQDGNRPTEEPGGDRNPRSKAEEEGVDLRTEVTLTRARASPTQTPSPATCPDCSTLLDPDHVCRNPPCPGYRCNVVPLRTAA